MKKGNGTKRTRSGFTILELLVVISIMAVVATLATGAVLKAVKQSREKRVDTTIKTLEMALMNFRARENRWPVTLAPAKSADTSVWFHGVDNAEVFKDLYAGGSDKATTYLDASALLVSTKQGRKTLREALTLHMNDMSIGYPLPSNPNIFCCYCIEFNLITDSVRVHRQDMRVAPYKAGWPNDGGNRVDGDHTCPEGYWGKIN